MGGLPHTIHSNIKGISMVLYALARFQRSIKPNTVFGFKTLCSWATLIFSTDKKYRGGVEFKAISGHINDMACLLLILVFESFKLALLHLMLKLPLSLAADRPLEIGSSGRFVFHKDIFSDISLFLDILYHACWVSRLRALLFEYNIKQGWQTHVVTI